MGFFFNFNTGTEVWFKERLGKGIKTPPPHLFRTLYLIQTVKLPKLDHGERLPVDRLPPYIALQRSVWNELSCC